MKDVSAWQMYDVGWTQRTVIGQERGGQDPLKKKEKKTTKIGLHRLCANDARNGGVWLKR